MNQKIEDQNRRMDRIIEWVKVCDSKTAILMSVVLLVPTFIIGTDWVLSKIEKITSLIIDACKSSDVGICSLIISLCLLLITIAFTIKSFYHFVSVLIAKTKEDTYNKKGIKTKSLIHFNNISKIEKFNEYKKKMAKESDECYYEDLLSQTYINAIRCAEKFKQYNKGILWLCLAMVALLFFIISLFFI